MSKVILKHNLTDIELEETLEKTLKRLQKLEGSEELLDNPHSNKLREESYQLFDIISKNMVKEIEEVIKRSN